MARFICGRLKRYPGIWRVDGIGCIRPSRDLGTRLTFHFSQIKPKFFKSPYEKEAPTGVTYALNGHSSWLRLFTPGSLWDNGAKTGAARLEMQDFHIDASQCIYTLPNEVSRFAPYKTLLPINFLQFGDNHTPLTLVKYAFVPVLNHEEAKATWLIIPTAELFRFYLGNSTRLIAKALTATTDKLIDTQKTTLIDQTLTIFDRTGTLTHREACCYGRALTGAAAMETYFGPHKYLSAASLQGSDAPLCINSRFPFNDQTTLLVAGKRIRLQNTETGKTDWAVYVTQIRRCTHSYGINHVDIISTGAIGNGTGGHGYGAGGPPRPPKIDPEVELEINDTHADPSMGTAIVGNLVYSADPITRIGMKKINVSREEFNGLRPRIVDTPPSGYTFENAKGGSNGSGNQQIDIVDVGAKDVSRDVLDFIDMLQELRNKTKAEGWEITTLACADQTSKHVGIDVITSFPSMPNQYRWYLVQDINSGGTSRPRLAVWVRIKIGTQYVYLVEMELKEKEPGRSSLAITSKKTSDKPIEFTEKKFTNLLTLTAIHNGWPPHSREWKDNYKKIAEELFNEFNFERIKHPYTVPVKENKKDKNKENSADEGKSLNIEETEKMKNISKNQDQKPGTDNINASSKVSPTAWATDVYEKILEAFPL